MPSYCFESCAREEAIADELPIPGEPSATRMYWVRLSTGEISQWLERDCWPEGVEFVRPVDHQHGLATSTSHVEAVQ